MWIFSFRNIIKEYICYRQVFWERVAEEKSLWVRFLFGSVILSKLEWRKKKRNWKWGLAVHSSKANKDTKLVKRKVCFISDASNLGVWWSPIQRPPPLPYSGSKSFYRQREELLLLLLLSRFSRVWLFATPWTAAYQAPPSMGFSRQEYWSGVPSPSPRERGTTSKNNTITWNWFDNWFAIIFRSLVVWSASLWLFEVQLICSFRAGSFLFPWDQFSELQQLISGLEHGHHIVMATVWSSFSTWWGFSIYKTAHRLWIRISSLALEEELKVLDFA